jgi:hypothetical protein
MLADAFITRYDRAEDAGVHIADHAMTVIAITPHCHMRHTEYAGDADTLRYAGHYATLHMPCCYCH